MLKCSASVKPCAPHSGNNLKFVVPARGDYLVLLTYSGETTEFGYTNHGRLGNYGGQAQGGNSGGYSNPGRNTQNSYGGYGGNQGNQNSYNN